MPVAHPSEFGKALAAADPLRLVQFRLVAFPSVGQISVAFLGVVPSTAHQGVSARLAVFLEQCGKILEKAR